MKKIIALIVSISLLIVLAGYLKFNYAASPQSSFRTAAVEKGDVANVITATGTVEPEETIDIGSQVTGKIEFFGRDPRGMEDSISPDKEKYKNKFVDYGTPVNEGDLLLQIDKAVYQAQRDQAYANLLRSEADLGQMKAKLTQAKNEWERAQSLLPNNAISHTDYDMAKANYDAATANIKVGEAVIQQSKASLVLAERNLGYTTITSPVKGEIISRRVNTGQTVVANMNAQSLFLLAKDLTKLQVWAQVNEADIGKISNRPGMPVKFTIDAFPGRTFDGHVEQIRLNAQMTQNVVLYTVVVAFDNSDRTVLPYLTANLRFEVDRHAGVLLVPSIALRWKPRTEQIVPELREKMESILAEKTGKGDPSAKPSAEKNAAKAKEEKASFLWVPDGNFVRPIEVKKGLTDNTNTEIEGKDIKQGMEIVTGEKTADEAGDSTNPFMPKIFPRRMSR
jgi:HlyD family secretion protein